MIDSRVSQLPALARALGVALDEGVREIADAVTRALPLRERE